MPNKSPHRITISDIVATVHCEQKAVFDKTIGDRTPQKIRIAKARGTLEHIQFASEAATIKTGQDSRCFVASHCFGVHSSETNTLRAWRDAHLQPYWLGRQVVRLYYALSPYLVRCLGKSSRCSALISRVLRHLLKKGVFGNVDVH
jgi:hypothetical protein